jgi:ABC-type antimicrobial peptide transport system permease subunit
MATLWLRLRADIRLRWRALLGLALLLGVAGGVVLTAAAGARRTDTAYPRLLQWANAAQVEVLPGGSAQAYFARLARLPQVAAMSSAIQYNMAIPVPHGTPDTQVNVFASPDDSLGVSADRVKILQGRMFSARAVGEVVIDPLLAGREHLRPGSTLRLLGVPDNPSTGAPDLQLAFPLAFRVSAVAVFDDQVVPATATDGEPVALLSPPFTRTAAARSTFYMPQAGVRLRPGATVSAFADSARALATRYLGANAAYTVVVNLSGEVAATERAISPEAVALAIFAALAGLITLAVLGQLLYRQLTLDSDEFPILRAIGMTRMSLFAVSIARLALVTVTGAVIAAAVAVAASPLMPIGPARLAEPQPGVEVDLTILGAGLLAVAMAPLVMLAPAAWRAAARAPGPLGVTEPAATRPSRLAYAFGRAGSVTSGIGVRMALEPGRGRTAVPVRSALAGTLLAVAAVCAAVVFGTSLIGLVGTPHEYGQNWAQELDLGFSGVPASLAAKVLAAEPAITGYAAGNNGQLTVDGQIVPAIGVDPVRGGGYLTLTAGRPPSGPGEIVLGTQTMHALHRQIGQTVRVAVTLANGKAGATAQRTMRVVGNAVFPAFGLPGLSDTDLGTGAIVSTALLSTPVRATGCVGRLTCYSFFLLRYRPGTNLTATAARLTAATTAAGCPAGFCTVTSDQRPGDIKNFAEIRDTPLILGAVLALLAVGTLAHVLLTGVRRRRRDLAVLKALGLTRSQVLRVVSWEASALAAVALLAGVPLGVLAGRWTWIVFAGSAGVVRTPVVELPLILLTIPVALLLANVIAAGPGWEAAQVRPATVLRTE